MSSKYAHVFDPIKVRGVDFKNRIIFAPPSPNLASDDCLVTHDFVNWFQMIARGGVSTMYVGNCSIDVSEHRDEAFQLDLGTDRIVLPLTRYADMGKKYGCNASLELNHNGEKEPLDIGKTSGNAVVGSSGNQPEWKSLYPVERPVEALRIIIDKFATAAKRMKKAGINVVLLHGGHGNLIAQFFSPLYNFRTDEYGGSLENRCRFAVEVCEAIRAACGEDFVIEMRISADEFAEGGVHIDETLKIIDILKKHVDIFHVSGGLRLYERGKYMRHWLQSYMMPREYNVHFARTIKKAHPDILVTTVGSIMSLDAAEEIISSGGADFVAMCRPLMADPEMPRKYAHNKPEDRRPCLRCLSCCGHLFVPKPIYCAVNPLSFMVRELADGRIPKADEKKRVAVIGGGPAGITALTTLSDRGHDVTLYEKSNRLGGNVIGAASHSFKVDCKDYLEWLVKQPSKTSANVLLRCEATADVLNQEGYDALIIAVGAKPVIPDIKGIDKPHVRWAADADVKTHIVGKRVLVIGAGMVGLEAAMDLKSEGNNVVVVDSASEADAKASLFEAAGGAARDYDRILKEEHIPIHYDTDVLEIFDDKIKCLNRITGEYSEIDANSVLYSIGMIPLHETVEAIRRCAPETEVYIVGDAKEAGSICEAVNSAFQAALCI